MKVLIVNKFYYPRGGDCVCAISLERLLRENGHETAVFAMDYPENLATDFNRYFAPEVSFDGGIGNKLRAVARVFGGAGAKRAFKNILADFRPDVVHFNNIHSYLSPAIVKMAKDSGARTVWTLHDYKLVCPAYSCLSGGSVCEECIESGKGGVLKKKCMKGSLAASAIGYAEALYWTVGKLERMTDCFVCPSRFMASKMEQGGFDGRKLKVVCNFVDPEKVRSLSVVERREPYYCYVGRLSAEKGVETLLKAAVQFPYPLKIAGGGPLAADLKERFGRCDNIHFLGHLSAGEVKKLLSEARFSVMPSECYENNPLSVIESLCVGTPVVGARIGGIPELIEPGNGQLFRSGSVDSLANNIAAAWGSPYDYAAISESAMVRFSDSRYWQEMLSVYEDRHEDR